VEIVPDTHLVSHTTFWSFIASIQTTQLVKTDWSLDGTAQWQVRGKACLNPRSYSEAEDLEG